MKICSVCKQLKPLTFFNRNNGRKDGVQATCRSCSSIRSKQYYASHTTEHKINIRRRTKILQAVSKDYIDSFLQKHPCVDCGEADPIVLEFDHIKGQKRATISYLIHGGYAIETLEEEIAKCVVRCANCHRRKTAIAGRHDRYHKSVKRWLKDSV